jgi:plasmid maintenance system antidote protein VapI
MAIKKLRSVHLGDILRNDFEPLRLTAYRLAKEIGVSRPTVTQLVARRTDGSPLAGSAAFCLERGIENDLINNHWGVHI